MTNIYLTQPVLLQKSVFRPQPTIHRSDSPTSDGMNANKALLGHRRVWGTLYIVKIRGKECSRELDGGVECFLFLRLSICDSFLHLIYSFCCCVLRPNIERLWAAGWPRWRKSYLPCSSCQLDFCSFSAIF